MLTTTGFLTTPLLLLDLLLTSGLPTPTICYTILINEIMVVTGLIGALVKSSYKWGYFVFGCVAFLFVAWTVVFEGRSHARALGADISKVYTLCGVWTIGLWFLYPISWGLSEGGNVIASDSEAIFYGILDILAKPVFGALLIWGHRNIDISRLGLHIREPAINGPVGVRSEKTVNADHTGNGITGQGISNGAATTNDTAPVHNTATTV
jgi:bacteriorhodopsin